MKTLLIIAALQTFAGLSGTFSVESPVMVSSNRVVVRYSNGFLSERDQNDVRRHYDKYNLVFKAVAWDDLRIEVSEAPDGFDRDELEWLINDLLEFPRCDD